MNRIDRVTAILIQLQSKKVVKAQDIAERFNISLRTVYRDVKTLEEAGIPVIGEAGVGYSIMDGYRLPPVIFTKEEATAFLTAEKLIEKLTDNTTEEHYKSAMYKVRSVLRSTEKDMLENIEDNIDVMRRYIPSHVGAINNTIQALLKSISEKKVLHIHYTAFYNNEKTERNIEPVGIFFAGGYWHAIAFCCLRNDYRDFRTDRMLQINTTDLPFKKQHPSLKTYLEKVASKEQVETIIIRVNKKTERYLNNQKYYNGFVSQKVKDNIIEMTFLTSSIEGFARWFLMFGDSAEIVQPAELKQKVKALYSDALANLEN